jgi:hypothetical protein
MATYRLLSLLRNNYFSGIPAVNFCQDLPDYLNTLYTVRVKTMKSVSGAEWFFYKGIFFGFVTWFKPLIEGVCENVPLFTAFFPSDSAE